MPEKDIETVDEKLLILPLGEESKKITQVISNDTARQIIDLLADSPLSASDIAERMNTPLTTVIYNIENLESVGLVKVEKIKYSEKGRKVKIYAPVKKVIVVMPGNTDRKSVLDVLRKYVGVVLAAVLASSVIEFFTKDYSRRASSMDMSDAPSIMSPQAPVVTEAVTVMEDEMMKKGARTVENYDASGVAIQDVISSGNATPAPTSAVEPVAEQAFSITPAATHAPASTEMVHTTALTQPEPNLLTNITDSILAHPGIVFLLGCLFVITALIIFEIIKKRKNE